MARSTLYEDFLASIKGTAPFTQGQRVMVACSGGPDSVALLDIMVRWSASAKLKVFACHLNHCLRGADSDGDAAFVGDLARSMGVELFTDRRDVAGLARERGLSIETAAREARYEFFIEAAGKLRCSAVVTAHTASDNAETFLQRLIEGAGVEGLGGIPHWRLLDSDRKVRLWRPLLFAHRPEIEKYLEARGLAFRVDKSNLEPVYLRNRIRLELLPRLKEFNPSIEQSLDRVAHTMSELFDYLSDDVRRARLSILEHGRGPILVMSIRRMEKWHPVVAREAVKYILIDAGVEWRELKYSHIDAVFALAASQNASGRIDLPGDVSVRRRYDSLCAGRSADFGEEEKSAGGSLAAFGLDVERFSRFLDVPGIVNLPGGLGEVFAYDLGPSDMAAFMREKGPDEEVIDADALHGTLAVRFPKAGDRFHPLGAEGRRKLQDVFTDTKVPAPQRPFTPVVEDRKGIIWVAGVRLADRVKVTDATKEFVTLRWIRTLP